MLCDQNSLEMLQNSSLLEKKLSVFGDDFRQLCHQLFFWTLFVMGPKFFMVCVMNVKHNDPAYGLEVVMASQLELARFEKLGRHRSGVSGE